jgi:hypothetical protein
MGSSAAGHGSSASLGDDWAQWENFKHEIRSSNQPHITKPIFGTTLGSIFGLGFTVRIFALFRISMFGFGN